MLFCKKCQIEYEEDKRFCPTCGSFLIRKEVFFSEGEEMDQSEEAQSKEKFVCPDCHIIYEKTKTCIRCGKEVVPFASLQGNDPPGQMQESETPSQTSRLVTSSEEWETSPEPLICPACKKEHLGGKSCIRCGAALVPHRGIEETKKSKSFLPPEDRKGQTKTPPLTEVEKELFQDESPDQPIRKRSVQEQIQQGRFIRKMKRDYPRKMLNWSGILIICVAAGYLLWSTYTHLIQPKSDEAPSPSSPKEMVAPSVSPPSAVPSSINVPSEVEEKEKITGLLENIRKANLGKDIDLFLLCYSKDFKDREGKKKSTLESWENFNFLDLTFRLESFTLSGNTARARVEWFSRFTSKGGGPPQESRTSLEVVFKKEEGDWKIGEVKSIL